MPPAGPSPRASPPRRPTPCRVAPWPDQERDRKRKPYASRVEEDMTYAPQTIVEPPLVVEHPDVVNWTTSADVVVVGQGGAGLCAALEARARGSSVLAIDRFGGGGSTAFSGGIFYAGETRWQKEGGV